MKALLTTVLLFMSLNTFANQDISCKVQMSEDSEILVEESFILVPGKFETLVFDFQDGVELFAQELNKYTGQYSLTLRAEKIQAETTSFSSSAANQLNFTLGAKNYLVLCVK
ncbi:MAG: hypothetical protein IPM97_05215 [Bdellovibrionaceae bacterium]|nr:hypothetical protein [Pseudobdellovibrionaceae bacterium]